MRSRRSIALPLALALLGAAPAAEAQAVREVKKATHGAWDVICAEGQDICVMRQIGKDAKGNEVLAVTVRALKGVKAENGQPVPALIDIIAPLGVALRAGLRVKIDAGKERAAPYDICLANGCLVREPMSEEFLASFRNGTKAVMTLVAPQQGDISVTISLKGFTKAFGELK